MTSRWEADSLIPTADSGLYTADGGIFRPVGPGFALDIYDNLNGSMKLFWSAPAIASPDSYNVYVNGVFNQNVAGLIATVTGLTVESYSSSAVAATPNNSARPQSMPPNGVVTPSGTYTFKVVPVLSGVEIGPAIQKTATVCPPSIMLVTPMKRVYPFGVDYG